MSITYRTKDAVPLKHNKGMMVGQQNILWIWKIPGVSNNQEEGLQNLLHVKWCKAWTQAHQRVKEVGTQIIMLLAGLVRGNKHLCTSGVRQDWTGHREDKCTGSLMDLKCRLDCYSACTLRGKKGFTSSEGLKKHNEKVFFKQRGSSADN
ncbi:hypothetical protein EV702DRAFT_1269664 [Suillus placidus]|uniref:Uncharacterized protein n=1 Tax=Suillus placidus TaxID=48579 RepID=A0A9P6ZQM4_9AGAM|nr:hypothetical protein EV702DRAFT_1269664 [Suillus placidus]